jgi:hypothetical protein
LPFRAEAGASNAETSCELPRTDGLILQGPVEAEGEQWFEIEGLGWAEALYLEAVEGEILSIEHRRQDVLLELEGSGGMSVVLIIGIVAAVVVVAGAAGGGYLWYRRRAA